MFCLKKIWEKARVFMSPFPCVFAHYASSTKPLLREVRITSTRK